MASKKGQGLSLTTIIIGALVIIVLIVLISIFRGGTKEFAEDYKSATDEEKKQEIKDQFKNIFDSDDGAVKKKCEGLSRLECDGNCEWDLTVQPNACKNK